MVLSNYDPKPCQKIWILLSLAHCFLYRNLLGRIGICAGTGNRGVRSSNNNGRKQRCPRASDQRFVIRRRAWKSSRGLSTEGSSRTSWIEGLECLSRRTQILYEGNLYRRNSYFRGSITGKRLFSHQVKAQTTLIPFIVLEERGSYR